MAIVLCEVADIPAGHATSAWCFKKQRRWNLGIASCFDDLLAIIMIQDWLFSNEKNGVNMRHVSCHSGKGKMACHYLDTIQKWRILGLGAAKCTFHCTIIFITNVRDYESITLKLQSYHIFGDKFAKSAYPAPCKQVTGIVFGIAFPIFARAHNEFR